MGFSWFTTRILNMLVTYMAIYKTIQILLCISLFCVYCSSAWSNFIKSQKVYSIFWAKITLKCLSSNEVELKVYFIRLYLLYHTHTIVRHRRVDQEIEFSLKAYSKLCRKLFKHYYMQLFYEQYFKFPCIDSKSAKHE